MGSLTNKAVTLSKYKSRLVPSPLQSPLAKRANQLSKASHVTKIPFDYSLGLSPDDAKEIQDYGIVYKREGVNLRNKPGSILGSQVLTRLPFNSRVFVSYSTNMHLFVATDDGLSGYVAESHVKTHLPEPNAKIYYTTSNDSALSISRQHYGGKAKWGSDHRFFVNGLVHVNHGDGKRGIYKEKSSADWQSTKVRAGYMIWIPSLEFMQKLKGTVGSGSISNDAWESAKKTIEGIGEFLLHSPVFQFGLIHGALSSVADVFIGIKDLIVLGGKFFKWLFGRIFGDSKSLWEMIKSVNWKELVGGIITDFKEKWNHENPVKKWHYRGKTIGYWLAEIVMAYLSVGAVQFLKWGGKAAKTVSKIVKLEKIANSRQGKALGLPLEKAKNSTAGKKAAGGFASAKHATKKTVDAVSSGITQTKIIVQKTGRVTGATKASETLKDGVQGLSHKANSLIPAKAKEVVGKLARKRREHIAHANKQLNQWLGGKFEPTTLPSGWERLASELNAVAPEEHAGFFKIANEIKDKPGAEDFLLDMIRGKQKADGALLVLKYAQSNKNRVKQFETLNPVDGKAGIDLVEAGNIGVELKSYMPSTLAGSTKDLADQLWRHAHLGHSEIKFVFGSSKGVTLEDVAKAERLVKKRFREDWLNEGRRDAGKLNKWQKEQDAPWAHGKQEQLESFLNEKVKFLVFDDGPKKK